MKRYLFLALLLSSISAFCDVRSDFIADKHRSASNYYAYPDKDLPVLTPAPEGYKPFYLSHYARHGSRWLITPQDYSFPVQQLEIGERNGKLTKRGKEVLNTLREVMRQSDKRLGELSDIGAEQHQGIARRMAENFPEIFNGKGKIDAKSTVVIRCILSMLNETNTLMRLNPELQITTDASAHDMYYMNHHDTIAVKAQNAARQMVNEFRNRHIKPEKLLNRLFSDKKFAADSIDGMKFTTMLFDLVGNMQSHHAFDDIDLYDLFPLDEMIEAWKCVNARWYTLAGDTPLTGRKCHLAHANLLRNIVETADSEISSQKHRATLRFGHESVVLPTVCLMGLNGMDYSTDDLESLANNWQCYKVFPMAANFQLIFYRKTGSDIVLVKILLNEREARLPIGTDCFPYYKWSDVRQHFIERIDGK